MNFTEKEYYMIIRSLNTRIRFLYKYRKLHPFRFRQKDYCSKFNEEIENLHKLSNEIENIVKS